MAAIITSSIPAQAFELIRDQVGAILALELTNQYNINNTYPNIRKVWVERWIPFDPNDLPTINVNLASGDYDGKTQRSVNGTYTYNIDIYTNAQTNDATGAADQYAMILMQKIAGMVRVILSAPAYNNLGFAPGLIGNTMIEGLYIKTNREIKDALSTVVGRMQFSVVAIEQMQITAAAVPLLRDTTTIRLNESDQGFYYDYNPIPQ